MNHIQQITLSIRDAMKHLEIHELRALEDYAQHLRIKLQDANLEALKRTV